MSSAHYRSISANERRSAPNVILTRATSTRARDHERPYVRENGSPIMSDGFKAAKDTENPRRRESRNDGIEIWREKSTVAITEKYATRRSPMKDAANLSNRGAPERNRTSVESPTQRKVLKESIAVPWAPTASLIPYSSAPLAARVSAPPLSRDAPLDLDPAPLASMAMHEQEIALIGDLLFVFMGYEGEYIRFDDGYYPSDEKSRLVGPTFTTMPGLDPSLKDLTMSMLTLATHYCAMEAFVEVQSREEYGSVNHALCAAIRKLLKDYLILVAQLEMKTITNADFTIHQIHLAIIPTAQSFSQLYALAQELLKKNALLEEDIDESMDDFDADNIIERLREGGDLLPGSTTKKKCIGGNVLALLTQRLATYSGDPAAKNILEMLLREASRPYTTMLNEWLHHGGINDPHAEFLVGERSSIKRERLDEDYTDEYWEKQYYIREKEVPPQLESVRDKVLLAGKYLNVVRECGGVNVTSKIVDTPTTFDDPRFLDNVNNAYSFANAELLTLLLTKNSLRSRLRSLKHYFFLDRAEFFLYFLEISNSELRKPHKSINTGKLQSLLDLVLYQPASIAVADPFKEDIKVKMNEVGLTQWLMKIVTVQGIDQDNPDSMMEQYKAPAVNAPKDDEKDINGFDALELDYTVPFPLSLIISRKTITRYQLIFRYTLALRHLETMLVECWSEHSKVKSWIHKSSNRRIEVWKRRAWTLRARMLVFVQQMLFFATAEVIEPNWKKLMAKVDEVEAADDDSSTNNNGYHTSTRHGKPKRTVDELMQDHVDMLDSCMKDLGLTQGKLLRIHAKLMTGCTMFATYTANLSRSLYAADPDLMAASSNTTNANNTTNAQANTNSDPSSTTNPQPELDPNRIVRMEDTLRRYEEHFNRHLKILIDSLNYYAATETVVLLGLCARLTNAEVQRRGDGGF